VVVKKLYWPCVATKYEGFVLSVQLHHTRSFARTAYSPDHYFSHTLAELPALMTSPNTSLLVFTLSLSLRRLREVRKSLATLELGILNDTCMSALASTP